MLPTNHPAPAGGGAAVRPPSGLGDFTADRRLLTLTAYAVLIGVMSACVAWALAWLIGAITNLAYYQRLSSALGVAGREPAGRLWPC